MPNSGPIPTFPKGKEIDNHAIGHGDIDSCKITTSTKCNGLLRVTPAANRNSYRVAKVGGDDTQGSVLRPSTLGWEIATPSELLLMAISNISPIPTSPKSKGYSPNVLTRCALVHSPLVESRRGASP